MSELQHNAERRSGRRFEVSWDVVVRGTDQSGRGFDEEGTLENLSSIGAFLYLARQVKPGERLELRIKVPFRRNDWMRYTAQVVRFQPKSTRAGIGVRFESTVPVFTVR